jgi:FixJ family two-component response regulator
VEMPGTTGHDVLSFCRAIFPEVPVVLMSAVAKEFRDPELEQGATAFLEKPFESDRLLAVLSMACGKTAGERAGVVLDSGRKGRTEPALKSTSRS